MRNGGVSVGLRTRIAPGLCAGASAPDRFGRISRGWEILLAAILVAINVCILGGVYAPEAYAGEYDGKTSQEAYCIAVSDAARQAAEDKERGMSQSEEEHRALTREGSAQQKHFRIGMINGIFSDRTMTPDKAANLWGSQCRESFAFRNTEAAREAHCLALSAKARAAAVARDQGIPRRQEESTALNGLTDGDARLFTLGMVDIVYSRPDVEPDKLVVFLCREATFRQ
ncbi:MAG: hypothetical protein WA624_20285 [Methylocella sp.]